MLIRAIQLPTASCRTTLAMTSGRTPGPATRQPHAHMLPSPPSRSRSSSSSSVACGVSNTLPVLTHRIWATCGHTARKAIAGSNSSQMAPSQHHGIWPAVLPMRAGLSSSAVGALLPNICMTCGIMTSQVILGLSSMGVLHHEDRLDSSQCSRAVSFCLADAARAAMVMLPKCATTCGSCRL